MQEILKNKKIIIFDGVCLLCNTYVKFIAKNDANDCFRFISMQNKKSIKTIKNKKDLSVQNESIILIHNKNSVKTKSSAIIDILSNLKFPYNLFSIIRIFPTFLLDYCYEIIAKNRYNLFGKIDHCSIIYSSDIKDIKRKIIM